MRLADSAPLQASQPVFCHTARDTGLFVAVCDSDEVDADGCPFTPVHDRRWSILHINNTLVLSGLVYVVMYLNDLIDSRCYTGFRIFLTITIKHISDPNHHTFPLPTVGTKCIEYTCRFSISRNRFATLTKSHSVCVHYYLKQSLSLLSQHPYYILQYTYCRYGAVNYSHLIVQ
jgi:hypothetical protein